MHDIGADNGGYLCRYVVTAEHLEALKALELSVGDVGPGLPKVDMEEIRRMQEEIEKEQMSLCSGTPAAGTLTGVPFPEKISEKFFDGGCVDGTFSQNPSLKTMGWG